MTGSIVGALALLSVCITAVSNRPGSLAARHATTATKPTPGVALAAPALAPDPIVSPTATPPATAPATEGPGSTAVSPGRRRAAVSTAPPSQAAASAPTQQAAPGPPAAADTCGAPPNPWGYNFCGGSLVYDPEPEFCDYFDCVLGFWEQSGYVEECADGMYGHSGGTRGSCWLDGGEGRVLRQ